jgi:hypothetical protein
MKNHRQTLDVALPARKAPVRRLRETLRADPLIWTTRRILATALMLGCLSVGSATLPGHANTDHPAGNGPLTASSSLLKPRHIIGSAWMY